MSFKQAAVIIAAAGRGDRLAENTNGTPKQFIELGGIPLFVWSLTTFMQHPKIKEAVLVVPEPWLDKTHAMLLEHLPQYAQHVTTIAGGNLRQESVYLALESIAAGRHQPSYVLIHDAARPFIATSYIDQIMVALEKSFACTLAIPLSDSIRQIKNKAIAQEMDRNLLALMQTPQGAEFKSMLEAHRSARKKQHVTTDDATLIQAYGINTTMVTGSRLNLKITQADDMLIARALVDSYGWRPGKVEMPN
jgi:2-C-methyl-D-erythritol 4-phosphate cytidylyltransferase